jgi:tRNA pseudouridine55 synthase
MAMTIMARSRRKGLPINGWLCLDKPQGMTSTSAVGFVRRITGAAKAGHGGTLDPLATGVLPIALGEATKTVSYVMDGEKHYRFTIRLGQATATDDSEGEVIAESDQRPATAAIEAALCRFIGTIEQVPPCFAAVKVAGERAYDLARRGEVVELEARSVRVRDLRLVERRDDDHATFDLISGKGVYVRSIARDLGRLLGCQAHVVELRRLKVGAFEAAHAVTPRRSSGWWATMPFHRCCGRSRMRSWRSPRSRSPVPRRFAFAPGNPSGSLPIWWSGTTSTKTP